MLELLVCSRGLQLTWGCFRRFLDGVTDPFIFSISADALKFQLSTLRSGRRPNTIDDFWGLKNFASRTFLASAIRASSIAFGLRKVRRPASFGCVHGLACLRLSVNAHILGLDIKMIIRRELSQPLRGWLIRLLGQFDCGRAELSSHRIGFRYAANKLTECTTKNNILF